MVLCIAAALVCTGSPALLELGRVVIGEETALGRTLLRPPTSVEIGLWAESLQRVGVLGLAVLAYAWGARRWRGRTGRWYAAFVNGGLSLVVLLTGWVALECYLRLKPIRTDHYAVSMGSRNWFLKYGLHNSWCFRGREFQAPKAHDTVRIVVIGDSVVFGHGINDPERRLTEVLERELNARGDGRYEVINLSECGMATKGEAGWLEFLGMRLDPDVVILVHVFNDI